MPLSTILLTYDLGFADSHLLLGTAVSKLNRAFYKRCQAGPRAREPRAEQLGKSVFHSRSPEFGLSPSISDTCDLTWLALCWNALPEAVLRETLWQPSSPGPCKLLRACQEDEQMGG